MEDVASEETTTDETTRNSRLSKRRCLTCREAYMGRKGQKYCSIQCTPPHQLKWKDNEVIYLASIHAGYGLVDFAKTLYRSAESDRSFQFRIFGILSDFKEQTGIDLYECLQQCTAETRMSKQKVPDILGMSDKEVAQAERRWDSALSSRFPERKLERRDKRGSIPIYYGISPPRY